MPFAKDEKGPRNKKITWIREVQAEQRVTRFPTMPTAGRPRVGHRPNWFKGPKGHEFIPERFGRPHAPMFLGLDKGKRFAEGRGLVGHERQDARAGNWQVNRESRGKILYLWPAVPQVEGHRRKQGDTHRPCRA